MSQINVLINVNIVLYFIIWFILATIKMIKEIPNLKSVTVLCYKNMTTHRHTQQQGTPGIRVRKGTERHKTKLSEILYR